MPAKLLKIQTPKQKQKTVFNELINFLPNKSIILLRKKKNNNKKELS